MSSGFEDYALGELHRHRRMRVSNATVTFRIHKGTAASLVRRGLAEYEAGTRWVTITAAGDTEARHGAR